VSQAAPAEGPKCLTERSKYCVIHLIFDQISKEFLGAIAVSQVLDVLHNFLIRSDETKAYDLNVGEEDDKIIKLSIPRTVKETLVENLRDEIIRGDLVPGQYLRLEEIAPRFDVSTMPVREALRDLEAEGLVTIFPHRGAIVTKLSADELQDI
jgi:hypothetical protein